MIQLVHLTQQKPEFRLLMPSAAVNCTVIHSTIDTPTSEHLFSLQWRQLPNEKPGTSINVQQPGSTVTNAPQFTVEKLSYPEHHHLLLKKGYRELVIRMNDPLTGSESSVTLMLDVELTKTEGAGES